MANEMLERLAPERAPKAFDACDSEANAAAPGFRSVLFPLAEDEAAALARREDYFRDLNLDRIASALARGREQYRLDELFCLRPKDAAVIEYRQAVLRDLEDQDVLQSFRTFSSHMNAACRFLERSAKAYYELQKQGWFLEAALSYCEAVKTLTQNLTSCRLRSRALLTLRRHLLGYEASPAFSRLARDAKDVKSRLADLRFGVVVLGAGVKVHPFEGGEDYSDIILDVFAKFREGAAEDYRLPSGPWAGGDIDARIAELAAKLHPEAFAALAEFCRAQPEFLDPALARLDRETQFYISYIDYIRPLRDRGLKFSIPDLAAAGECSYASESFDLALAAQLAGEDKTVVTNDFKLEGKERILIVTGPNQGGKTTYARMFGQLHYLASLGLMVPGSAARLSPFDEIYTHFERAEQAENLYGKLYDDLLRARAILDAATPQSIAIVNEIFTSTALKDAVYLSEKILEKLAAIDVLCVWVTFIDELASFSDRTVSMVACVDGEDPSKRTFKIERRPADGLSYAAAIAEKYGLTRERIKERFKS